ncbi:MAG: hypothetical protein HQL06_06820 [Nitrospirae bacterium]|nr:hypothetical protein [Nitrospirota bacterium]
MKKKAKSVTHRPVRDKKPKQNIADDPEMKELKAILASMSTEEQQRTLNLDPLAEALPSPEKTMTLQHKHLVKRSVVPCRTLLGWR